MDRPAIAGAWQRDAMRLRPASSSLNHHAARGSTMLKDVLIAVAQSSVPLTSRQVAEAIGMDYELNFNKREMRYAKKLQGFVVKRRLTPEEMTTPTHLTHWFLADQWKGQALDEIVKAFDATPQCVRENAQADLHRKLDEINRKLDEITSQVATLIDDNNEAIAAA